MSENTLPHGDEGCDDAGGADRLDARRDGAVEDVPSRRDFGAASALGQGQDEFAVLDDGRLGAVDCTCADQFPFSFPRPSSRTDARVSRVKSNWDASPFHAVTFCCILDVSRN